MIEYTILEVDFENGIIHTMEGRIFKINLWDVSVMAGWCPTEKIILTKYDGEYILRHYSGGIVHLK